MPEPDLYVIDFTGTEPDEDKLFTVIRSKVKTANPITRTVRRGKCKASYGPFSKAIAEVCKEMVLKNPGISNECLIRVTPAPARNRPTA
jgi:hypothetical protein